MIALGALVAAAVAWAFWPDPAGDVLEEDAREARAAAERWEATAAERWEALQDARAQHRRTVSALQDSIATLAARGPVVIRQVDTLIMALPDSARPALQAAIDAEREVWRAEIDVRDALIEAEREIADDLLAQLHAERQARAAVREEADRYRALAEHAQGEVRKAKAVGVLGVVVGVLVAIFGG